MYHKTAAFIVFICNKKRVHEIFLKSNLQIMQLKISTSILGFKNYFLTYSALQTLVPPNLCLFLRLSQILNIFNVSFSSSLNRLNTLSSYQKFVQSGNSQILGSVFIQQSCVVLHHNITDKSSYFESRCYLILEVHDTLIANLPKQQMKIDSIDLELLARNRRNI